MALRVAMIGCGYFGRFHLNAWLRLKDVTVVGVAEISPVRRIELSAYYPDIAFYDNLDRLLEKGDVDILDVVTPSAHHAAIIAPLLGRIRTIICQKPFCGGIAEAEALTAKAEGSGTALLVHENFRFMPWYRAIKQLLDRNGLGIVRQAQFRLRPGDGGGKNAYLNRQPYFRDMKRFLVHETGIHWIDTFRYLFGEPQSVYADLWRSNPSIRGEDSGLLAFTFSGGKRILLDANRTLDHAADNHRLTMGEFTIEGSNASVFLNGFGALTLRRRGENEMRAIDYPLEDIDFGGDCVRLFQAHVVAAMQFALPFETKAADYLINMRIEEAVYRAAEVGARLALAWPEEE